MEGLSQHIPTASSVFSAAALMTGLIRLEVKDVSLAWLKEWTDTPELTAAFPQLQECIVYPSWRNNKELLAARDMRPFLQSMASRPLSSFISLLASLCRSMQPPWLSWLAVSS